MKLISKLAVAVLSVSGALLCAAEVTNYSVKDISRILGKNVTFKENSVVCNGQSMLVGKKIIEIDPAKKYTFKFTAVGNAEKATRLFAGFAMLDAQGRSTEAQHWQGYQDTLTEVAAPAKKGDTVLKVKNGAKWRKGNYFTIACNAKADLSDIPNGNNIAENITDVKKVGDVWEITVKKPLRSDVSYPSACQRRLSLYRSHKDCPQKRSNRGQRFAQRYCKNSGFPCSDMAGKCQKSPLDHSR